MFLDSLGLIVTKAGDGGDTAQNEGFFAIPNVGKVSNYHSIIDLLEPKKDGIWVRHPVQYPDTKDFTRDQTIPNIIAMGMFGYKDALKRMLLAQVKRFFRYQDGSIPSPEHFGQAFRALGWKITYPLLWFGDIFMLINTLLIVLIRARTPGPLQQWLGKHVHWIFVQGEPNNAQGIPQDVYGWNNVGVDKNHIASLYQAKNNMPTLISLLARKIYFWFRPNYQYITGSGSPSGPQYALDTYYKIDNPEIAQAWAKEIKGF